MMYVVVELLMGRSIAQRPRRRRRRRIAFSMAGKITNENTDFFLETSTAARRLTGLVPTLAYVLPAWPQCRRRVENDTDRRSVAYDRTLRDGEDCYRGGFSVARDTRATIATSAYYCHIKIIMTMTIIIMILLIIVGFVCPRLRRAFTRAAYVRDRRRKYSQCRAGKSRIG